MKNLLRNWLLRDILGTIVVSDILNVDKGKIFINGKVITDAELATLHQEIAHFEGTGLCRLLFSTPTSYVQEQMFKKATSTSDLWFGKGGIYVLSVQKDIMDRIREAKTEQ